MTADQYEGAQRRYFELEGIEPESRWIEAEVPSSQGNRKVRTHVLEVGQGPPVVLVHGGGGLAAGWAPLLTRLRGYRSIAPDRPGGGLSDGFDYRGVDLRRHAVRWLEGVLDACEIDSAIIVANSMGARWATWFALEHPNRVRALAALGIPAGLLATSAPFPMRLLGKPLLGELMMALERPSPAQARALWRRMGHDQEPSPELVELTVALQMQPTYARTWRTLLGRVLTLRGVAPGVALDADELRRLQMPLVLAIGERDPFGSLDDGRRAAEIAPDATFEKVGIGHLPWLDEPERCAAIVEALAARVERASARAQVVA